MRPFSMSETKASRAPSGRRRWRAHRLRPQPLLFGNCVSYVNKKIRIFAILCLFITLICLIMILSIPVLSDIENLYNNYRNARKQDTESVSFARTFIYVIKNLAEYGGLETRLIAYADALSQRGCRVVFVTERNRNRVIRERHSCIHLNFHACNFQRSLVKIIRMYGADVVDFQIKNRRSVHRLDIESLKKYCRTGCVIHGEVYNINPEILRLMDYRVIVSDLLCSIDYANIGSYRVIPNAIHAGSPVWSYRGQRRALIVSRLKDDKYRQVCAAIDYCLSHGVPFDIAGSPVDGRMVSRLRRCYSLSSDIFALGAIPTREFLYCNSDRYLFVAGVGQVLLEAGAAVYPCMLASDLGAGFSTFLTKYNIRNNFGRNLTLAYFNEKLHNVRVESINVDCIDDYNISGAICEFFSFDDRFVEYYGYVYPDEIEA